MVLSLEVNPVDSSNSEVSVTFHAGRDVCVEICVPQAAAGNPEPLIVFGTGVDNTDEFVALDIELLDLLKYARAERLRYEAAVMCTVRLIAEQTFQAATYYFAHLPLWELVLGLRAVCVFVAASAAVDVQFV